jgi:hypothetical protein
MTLRQDQRIAIRQNLVSCLGSESLQQVRNKIGDAVAEIARQYTDNGMSRLTGNSLALGCERILIFPALR